MISLLPFALLVAGQGTLGPVCPPGSNLAFNEAVIKIEQHLQKKEFAEAEKALGLLPKTTISVRWDESAVPEKFRKEFANARDAAFAQFQDRTFKIVQDKNADISFSFTKDLPPNADTAGPAGAVHMFGIPPEDPRLETVIALGREGIAGSTEYADVHNEVGHAVVSYLGVARTPIPITFSARTEGHYGAPMRIAVTDMSIAKEVKEVVDMLGKAVAEKTELIPAMPKLILNPTEITLDPVLQGKTLSFSLLVTNAGNAPLALKLRPDCSCLSAGSVPFLEAGASTQVPARIDTTQVVGDLERRLILYANDPETPVRIIPVKFKVIPRYRFLMDSRAVLVDATKPTELNIYLALAPDSKIEPKEVQIDGVKAEVTYAPWSGDMADPELNEGILPRKGYVFKVKIAPTTFPGRAFATLSVGTDNMQYPTLRAAFTTQRGIVALPEMVFLGEFKNEPRRASFFLSRPGKPFKITKIETDSSNFSGTARETKSVGEYKVTVEYDGKGLSGNVNAQVIVHTDDPKQPKIKVMLSGIVK